MPIITAIPVLLALVPAPTAIVDSVLGDVSVHALQLLTPGTTLDLGASGRIRIAYFPSCVYETIRGGRLRVGVTASIAVDGVVARTHGECEPPPQERWRAGALGTLVLRNVTLAPPVRRLRTPSPWVVTTPGSRIHIRRIDAPGHEVFLTADSHLVDLAALGVRLGHGAHYELCRARRCVRVWIDNETSRGAGVVLDRVVALH